MSLQTWDGREMPRLPRNKYMALMFACSMIGKGEGFNHAVETSCRFYKQSRPEIRELVTDVCGIIPLDEVERRSSKIVTSALAELLADAQLDFPVDTEIRLKSETALGVDATYLVTDHIIDSAVVALKVADDKNHSKVVYPVDCEIVTRAEAVRTEREAEKIRKEAELEEMARVKKKNHRRKVAKAYEKFADAAWGNEALRLYTEGYSGQDSMKMAADGWELRASVFTSFADVGGPSFQYDAWTHGDHELRVMFLKDAEAYCLLLYKNKACSRRLFAEEVPEEIRENY